MKKSILIVIVLIALISIAGCGISRTTTIDQPDQNPGTTTTKVQITPTISTIDDSSIESDNSLVTEEAPSDEGISVDDGLFDVTITLPASFFDDNDDFDPESYNEEQGYKKTVVNEDGSVSITMSKAQHNEIMKEMEESIDQSLDELIEAEDTPYIKAIESSKGYRTVIVKVDRVGYEAAIDLTPLLIGISALMYQQFDGVDLHCEVKIQDVNTGEILHSVIYPDVLQD